MKLIYFTICVSFFGSVFLEDVKDKCHIHRKCKDCVSAAGCQWCAEPNFNKGSVNHCFEAGKAECDVEHTYPTRIPKPLTVFQDKQFSSDTLFRPQHIHLKLHVGEEYHLNLTYKHARDYPVDLYYLMDLSASMEDDKKELSLLGSKLAKEMRNLTRDFQLGFGSFVDKVIMPYVSTVPEKLKAPCKLKDNQNCAPPYSFKNHLKLNINDHLFSEHVEKAPVSGNLDSPEGGLDAIMQAIVCQKNIGWRPKARHLLVFSTDADFHFAGDGRLAGIIEPNDMKCYLNSDGNYLDYLRFDYPSISQINQVAKKFNINMIFAVTEGVKKQYQKLAERIDGATHGILSTDSSNIVKLVRKEYEAIVDNIILTTAGDGNREYVEVRFNTSCMNETWKERHTCQGLHQGDEIKYTATIKVLKCPEQNNTLKLYIKPQALEDNITVEIDIDCDCQCEQTNSKSFERNSVSCTKNGNLRCGVCECNNDWFGDKCQCKKNSTTNLSLNENACRPNNDSRVCSDVGVCECETCSCNSLPNANGRYYGTFCECNDFECRRYNGLLCSGLDHGSCKCGLCKCKSGWSGKACECRDSIESCVNPSSQKVCNDQGSCQCGGCLCKGSYSGKYCEECPLCPGQQCDNYKEYIECTLFKTTDQKKCVNKDHITIIEVDLIEEEVADPGIRVCKIPDESGCTFVFRYLIGNSTVEVQRTKECGSNVNVLALVLGVIGGIVFLGLLFLLVWKIVTSIHDRREYLKFEKERAMSKWDGGGNPFYKPATSTFNNPMFGNK